MICNAMTALLENSRTMTALLENSGTMIALLEKSRTMIALIGFQKNDCNNQLKASEQ